MLLNQRVEAARRPDFVGQQAGRFLFDVRESFRVGTKNRQPHICPIRARIEVAGPQMKVFISYGDVADQVTALRLQALGAVNGLTVYVPPAHTRRGAPTLPDSETGQKLNQAEIVLGVVGAGLTEACRQELNTGLALHKNMIVMSHPTFAPQLQPYFGSNLVVMDPTNPDGVELGIVQHLKALDAQQSAKTALLALGTLALGLLLLAPADRN
jgi:hypothetical protein